MLIETGAERMSKTAFSSAVLSSRRRGQTTNATARVPSDVLTVTFKRKGRAGEIYFKTVFRLVFPNSRPPTVQSV